MVEQDKMRVGHLLAFQELHIFLKYKLTHDAEALIWDPATYETSTTLINLLPLLTSLIDIWLVQPLPNQEVTFKELL